MISEEDKAQSSRSVLEHDIFYYAGTVSIYDKL